MDRLAAMLGRPRGNSGLVRLVGIERDGGRAPWRIGWERGAIVRVAVPRTCMDRARGVAAEDDRRTSCSQKEGEVRFVLLERAGCPSAESAIGEGVPVDSGHAGRADRHHGAASWAFDGHLVLAPHPRKRRPDSAVGCSPRQARLAQSGSYAPLLGWGSPCSRARLCEVLETSHESATTSTTVPFSRTTQCFRFANLFGSCRGWTLLRRSSSAIKALSWTSPAHWMSRRPCE
jgi:hypothetical protein